MLFYFHFKTIIVSIILIRAKSLILFNLKENKFCCKMYRSGCVLASALDIVGDKWSLIIIRDLFIERTTFKEFLAGPEKIASNILSHRLKWLSVNDIIKFMYSKGNKKVKHYYLTDKGINLYPTMVEMMKWGEEYLDNEYNEIAQNWLEATKNKSNKLIVKEEISQYRKHKEKLLATI